MRLLKANHGWKALRANLKPNMAGEFATKCLHLVNKDNILSFMLITLKRHQVSDANSK